MRHTKLTPYALLAALLGGLAADELHAEEAISAVPFAVLGMTAYGDSAHGNGAGDIQNANGLYNTHTDGQHSHGGEFRSGLNLQTLEFGLHARAPGLGEAGLRLSREAHRIAVEDAWLRSALLPGGLQAQAGRFFSAIGLQNDLHPHAWDFVDQALPYQLLLAGGLRGDGIRVNWQLPLSSAWRLRLGTEALKSSNAGVAAQTGNVNGYVTTSGKTVDIPMSGAANWPQVWTVLTQASWTYAPGQRLFGGLAAIHGRQHQELHTYHPGINDADHALQGATRTDVVSVGWERDGTGEHGAGGLTLTAEYMKQTKNLTLSYHDTKPWNIGMPRQLRIDGYVLQALYNVAPRWQIGLRLDHAGNVHEALRSASPVQCAPPYQAKPCPRQNSSFDPVRRVSAVATWNLDAHQRLRVQVSRADVPVAEDVNADGKFDALRKRFNQVFLQYQISFGGQHAHAH